MSSNNFFKKIPLGVKASLGLFAANLITKGIAYLVTPIFTRLLSPEEFGRVSLFTTWMTIFGFVAMFCLSAGVFNNGMSDYPDDRDSYSFSMLVLSNAITIIFSAILLTIYPLVKTFLKIDFGLIILMCAVFLFQPAYNFWYTRQRYEYKYKGVLIATSISALLSQGVAIIVVLFGKGNKDYLKIIGSEIPLLLFYLFFYFLLTRKAKGKIKFSYWKAAIIFNLPLIPHYLSTYLLSSADKIMISNLVGDDKTAFYTVAHSIAAIALIVWSAINGSFLPFVYEKCKKQDFDSLKKVATPLVSFFGVVCISIVLFAPEVIRLMATSQYYEAIYVIPPIIGGVFFQVQYYLYANVVFYYKKPVFVMIGSVFSFVINIVLNYFCITRWGYIAAGYTTIVSYGIQAIIDFAAMRLIAKRSIYDMKIILMLSIAIIVIVVLINFIYDFWIIRYSILTIVLALCVVFRKRIFAIFNFKNSNELDEAINEKPNGNEANRVL